MISRYPKCEEATVEFSKRKNKGIGQVYKLKTKKKVKRKSGKVVIKEVEVEVDSTTELDFFQYCRDNKIEILEYGTRRYRYIDDTFNQTVNDDLLKKLGKKFPGIKRMRKPESSFYKPDLKIKVNGIEFIVEIKSGYTKTKMSHKGKDLDTAYHLKRNMFLSKYSDLNFLEVTKEGDGFIFEVYSPNDL